MSIYVPRIPLTDAERLERAAEEDQLTAVRNSHRECQEPQKEPCEIVYDACGTPLHTIKASEHDPYYIDALAAAVQNGNGRSAIRVKVNGNIPIVRNTGHKSFVYPGYDGIPNNVRSSHAFRYLKDEPINIVSTIPLQDGMKRVVSVIERSQEFARWYIIEAEVGIEPPPSRITPAYFPRGRGAAPWWKTLYPDGSPSTATTV